MKTILEKSRYLALIGIIALLIASIAAFAWGALKTWQVILLVISTLGEDKGIIVGFIEIIDAFLVATAILIFMFSLYGLNIDRINAPEWMLANNFYELKGKLSGMIVLVMAVKFLERFLEAKDARELMFTAIATTLVSAALIAFGYFGRKE